MKRTNYPLHQSGIYQILSIRDSKIYIGSGINLKHRQSEHLCALRKNKHGNRYLQRYYNKYGEDNFQFAIIEFCFKDKLIEREQYWIDFLIPHFNLCKVAGSRLGIKHTQKSKDLIAEKAKIRMLDPLVRQRVREAGIKQMQDPKQIKNLRDKALKRFKNPENNPMFGRHHSEETRLKIKKAIKKRGGMFGKNNPNYGNYTLKIYRTNINRTK